jgi:hypothetical protein
MKVAEFVQQEFELIDNLMIADLRNLTVPEVAEKYQVSPSWVRAVKLLLSL